MQEQQTQEIIVQSTRGAHSNGHEHMEQENPREADGNVVFSPLPHFFKTSSGWGAPLDEIPWDSVQFFSFSRTCS